MASDPRPYLCPVGVIRGEAARPAIEAGWASPLGDDRLAFTGCRIWLRDRHGTRPHLVRAADVQDFAAAQPAEFRREIETTLERLIAPPGWPDGFPGPAPVVMGVVNVTPDSFSDGGLFATPDDAIARARTLWREGADIVDVGGESTRPGAQPIAAEEEIRRVLPVVRALAAEDIPASIDSRKAAVMEAAIAAGARAINDVTALRHDPRSLDVARASRLPIVLMHSQGEPATMQHRPRYDRALLDVYDHLRARIEACVAAGIDRAQLMIDPGIGFGKALEHNLDILHHIWLYRGLGVPVVLGVSRKSFIARLAGDVPPDQRLPGSLAAGLHGLINGVSILRVHDVAATRQAAQVASAVLL